MTDPAEAHVDAMLADAGEHDVWCITLVALKDPCPAAVRVRAMLKRALRSHGLKCVAVTSGKPQEEIET
jgi:hypothetical protein